MRKFLTRLGFVFGFFLLGAVYGAQSLINIALRRVNR